MDAWVTGWNNDTQIWMNDGAGTFAPGQSLNWAGRRRAGWVALADFDNDGDLDAIEGNNFDGGAKVWMNQNLEPTVTLSVANATIPEAGGTTAVTATLSAAHGSDVIVELAASGTATPIDDYTLSASQIVIAAGATSASVTLTTVQDTFDEPDETVVIDVSSAANAQEAGTQQVTVTIEDDDEPVVPEVTLAFDNATIDEDGGTATLTITLSEATTSAVTVNLAYSGTAMSGVDYNASGTQAVIVPGSTSATVAVTAVDDEEDESDETVVVYIDSVSGGTETGDQQAVTTITDDDAPPGFTVAALTANESGFVVEFSTELDTETLNLYDAANLARGAADVVLVGASSGAVRGSVVVDSRSMTFIKSGGPLAADSYTVTLRSGADGLQDAGGQLLDGNGDGTAGDDYSGSFDVAPAVAHRGKDEQQSRRP